MNALQNKCGEMRGGGGLELGASCGQDQISELLKEQDKPLLAITLNNLKTKQHLNQDEIGQSALTEEYYNQLSICYRTQLNHTHLFRPGRPLCMYPVRLRL